MTEDHQYPLMEHWGGLLYILQKLGGGRPLTPPLPTPTDPLLLLNKQRGLVIYPSPYLSHLTYTIPAICVCASMHVCVCVSVCVCMCVCDNHSTWGISLRILTIIWNDTSCSHSISYSFSHFNTARDFTTWYILQDSICQSHYKICRSI